MSEIDRVEILFGQWLALATPETRERFLQDLDEPEETKRQLVKLTEAHDQAGSFLGGNPGLLDDTTDSSPGNLVGQRIGPYKLLQELGEGGMGTVYSAERQHPVRQRVALKIIKHGMDSKKFVARFEVERQALAMMDHPNIAQVLDAGCTQSGRPYFVMELVKGIPISEFCDENRLSTRQRLELFQSVCRAVQHAHQKGVIHRDLKPSNVLVALYDQNPVAKVIDFGVAKATGQLTNKTLFTEVGSILGTLEYMSPEQAVLNQLDVDTRTDVYSLGVLLYELLTGDTPLDRKRLRDVQLTETLRMIREDEPPKPSTRISTQGKRMSATAAYRNTKPDSLASEIRGDLDWIVMKALSKERSRRYESASRLCDDVERYLNDELVEARPPSSVYQLQKLYSRNRVFLNAFATVFVALVLGLGISLYFWQKASRLAADLQSNQQVLQRNNQKLRESNEALQDALVDRAISDAMSGNFRLAEVAIQQASDAGADPDLVAAIGGLALYFSGDVEEAIVRLRDATKRNEKSIEAWSVMFLASMDAGEYERMGECRQQLLGLTPKTNVERMLRAMTDVFADPSFALSELNDLVDAQPNSVVLHVLRAMALNEQAKVTKDAALLVECLEEFEWSSQLLPENRFVQNNHLGAIANTIQLFSLQPEDANSDRLNLDEIRRVAESLVASLESNEDSERFSRLSRATYFATIQDKRRFYSVTEKSSTGSTAQLQTRAAELFAREDFEELRKYLSTSEKWSADTYSTYLDMEDAADQETRSKLAQDAFDRVFTSHEFAFGNDVLALEVFLLAGDLDGLQENASRVRDKKKSYEWHQYETTVELFLDPSEANVRDYVNQAEPFSEEGAYANCVAALIYLARGNETQAKEHFRQSIAKGKFDWWSHVWAEAFLKRIEAGKDWPHWLLSK